MPEHRLRLPSDRAFPCSKSLRARFSPRWRSRFRLRRRPHRPTPFEPTPGQAGKDVVWVPTPPELVEKMLDMAKVTPQDIVMDLGSGDGRNVIAAAKRGARAIGFEFNPDMVALSRRLAQEAGVPDRATFVEGDMFEADISKATVLALFLLPSNLDKLAPKFLALKPGTRIVQQHVQRDRVGSRRDRDHRRQLHQLVHVAC